MERAGRDAWMETNPDLLNPGLYQCFPLCIPSPYPQHTLRKEEVNFLNPIKKRNKDGIVYKQI